MTNTNRAARLRRSIALQAKVRATLAACVHDAGAGVALCDRITSALTAQLALVAAEVK